MRFIMNKTQQPVNQSTQKPDLTKVQPKVGNAPINKEQADAKRAENPATHGSQAPERANTQQKSRP
jgi:hypothetical protein